MENRDEYIEEIKRKKRHIYYLNSREHRLEYNRKYYQEHKDEFRKRYQQEEYKKKHREQSNNYYYRHRDEILAKLKEKRKENV